MVFISRETIWVNKESYLKQFESMFLFVVYQIMSLICCLNIILIAVQLKSRLASRKKERTSVMPLETGGNWKSCKFVKLFLFCLILKIWFFFYIFFIHVNKFSFLSSVTIHIQIHIQKQFVASQGWTWVFLWRLYTPSNLYFLYKCQSR